MIRGERAEEKGKGVRRARVFRREPVREIGKGKNRRRAGIFCREAGKKPKKRIGIRKPEAFCRKPEEYGAGVEHCASVCKPGI